MESQLYTLSLPLKGGELRHGVWDGVGLADDGYARVHLLLLLQPLGLLLLRLAIVLLVSGHFYFIRQPTKLKKVEEYPGNGLVKSGS